MSAPPASSVTVAAEYRAHAKVPGECTREVTLDAGASTDTPVSNQGPGGSLPGANAGYPLHPCRQSSAKVPVKMGNRRTRDIHGMILSRADDEHADSPASNGGDQSITSTLKTTGSAHAAVGLGATRMNNLRMLRTRMDNRDRAAQGHELI